MTMTAPVRKAQVRLRDGETVEVEGIEFVAAANQDLKPGDFYIAERNTGPKLLTVQSVNFEDRWVVPVEPAYCFDLGECVKVQPADEL